MSKLYVAKGGDDELDDMARRALNVYNNQNCTLLELKKVEKANHGITKGGFGYFVTFQVVDKCDPAKPPQVFQAKVVKKRGDVRGVVRQVRPKPTGNTSKKGRRRAAA